MSGRYLLLLAAVTLGPSLRAGASQPFITEFMARNQGTLLDEDLETPDWVELYNPGDTPVDLKGWSLTDDAKDLGKWRFPEVSLPPGKFLVVFCSGKDRADPSRNLHTSFDLFSSGYLGLVNPERAVISDFGAQYPLQVGGVSHGVTMESKSTFLVPVNAPSKTLVPLDGNLGLTWTESTFDDASWIAGNTAVGFDNKPTPTYDGLIQSDIPQMRAVNSSAYIRLPFTVENPAAFSSLILRMKYEDGFVAYLNGKEVARRNAPATLAWNSRAGTRRAERDALVFDEFNVSSSIPLLQQGSNVLAIHGLNETKSGASFLILPEMEAVTVLSVNSTERKYFDRPTPGWANGAGWPGVADVPIFSQPEGSLLAPLNLTLSAASPDAEIHYTLDRTEPDENSPTYESPLVIDATNVVRARVYQQGLLPSPIVSQTYVFLDTTVKDFNTNLPIVIFNTYQRQPNESTYTTVSAEFIDTTQGRASITDAPDFIGYAAIKWRGSSSLQFPKKSYAMEIQDDRGEDLHVPLLGLPQESDWVLYAPYTDKTLMRDVLAYEWSNWIGRYAPRTRFVELYLTSGAKVRSSDYQGVYVLIEKIKRDPNRVDLATLYASSTDEPDVSGGYILKKDRLDPGDAGFVTSRGQNLAFVTPKEREITAKQRAYISGYLNKFEAALYGTAFKDPVAGYAAHIDVDSFIDHHVMVEITKNIDGYRLSTFMFKDRNGKLNMGPIWDYNLTLGNANYLDGWLATGWYYQLVSDADYPWYRRIFQDGAFVQRYASRWIQFRTDQFKVDRLLASIDEKVELLKEAEPRDHKKWPILGIYIWPNWFIGKNYTEEIGFMEKWVRDRVAWMDSQFVPMPVFSQAGGTVPSGFQLSITAAVGTIYYTVDRSDPLGTDGNRSATAIQYAGPITITSNTRVRARVNIGGIWSGVKEGNYVVSVPTLVITEIMYRPGAPPAGSPYLPNDFEFIELKNIGDTAMNLGGVRFTKGVTYDFSTSSVTSLDPGAYVVLVRNRAAFISRYGEAGIAIAGAYAGDFNDSGESLTLLGPIDEQIHSFIYSASWYPESSGGGYSLVIKDPRGARELWGDSTKWRRSTEVGGSPGKDDPEPVPAGLQLAGDLNQDGRLSLSDGIDLLKLLFTGAGTPLPCGATIADGGNQALLDLDTSGDVDITDAIFLLSYLYQSGAPPAHGTACFGIQGCRDACVAGPER
jgi:hypothetical protein